MTIQIGQALPDLEVDVIEDKEELEKLVKLNDPFKLRSGQLVRRVRVVPVPWSAMMEPGVFSGLMSQISYSALKGCIAGVDCVEGAYTLTQDELDEISRRDVVNINRISGTLAAGIDLQTNIRCSKEECSHLHIDALDWTFDNFFGSSLPMSETANS